MARVKIGNVRTPIEYLKHFFVPAVKLVEISSASEIDSMTENGTYYLHSINSIPLASFSFTACHLEVQMIAKDFGWHIIRLVGVTSELRRCCNAGVWGEWEWENPLMQMSVEYRTTERYWNKPVYARLVTVGVFPTTGQTDFETGIEATSVVRLHAAIGSNSLPIAGNMEINTYNKDGKIVVRMNTNGERLYSDPVFVELYYTKT